jgi:hypothetical protein
LALPMIFGCGSSGPPAGGASGGSASTGGVASGGTGVAGAGTEDTKGTERTKGSGSKSLVLSNGVFLRRATLPPWAATPTDVPPRVP